MTPERWQRTEELYHAARAHPPAARAAFLAEACGGDEGLRRDVESLLNEPSSDPGFLARPVLAMPAHLIPGFTPAAMAGLTLGGYHLQSLLGAGGMGEVYRARDPKLGRDVAIKILSREFTSNPDRLARFEREARTLAALNHPNICAIYGLEHTEPVPGSDQTAIRFLILELIDGETLAAKLARSRGGSRVSGLPAAEALVIARQIADALESAHERGIVHRDLKPANISITADGVVKVLDFGLAKVTDPSGAGNGADPAKGDTREGLVIGTAAYMSPEQARGLPVDRRTDIWAFGCVLYEMLTGRVAFAGETVSDSIAKVLEREPDWSALPANTPTPIRRLLLRCLAKDPKKRLRDVGDVRIEIDGIDDLLPGTPAEAPALDGASRGRARWLPALALVALAVAVALWGNLGPTPADNPLPSEGFRTLTNWPGTEGHAEISPDGKVVAFLADRDGEFDLFAGQVAAGEFSNLTKGIESLDPVAIQRRLGFSADSTMLWFGPQGQKLEMPWSGGAPRPFLVGGSQTPAWSSDERLVYFNQQYDDSLWLADGKGRNSTKIAIAWSAADRARHNHNMVWSPDNRWIYFVHGDVRDWNHQTDDMDIWRISPSGGSPERLTYLNTSVTFLAMLDQDTLVFIAPEEDGSGSWLWSLDVGRLRTSGRWWGTDRVVPRRIPTGLEQYTSVSASRDGGRVVATRANPTATLWSVPILGNREAGEDDVRRFDVQTERALSPRYARHAASPLLFYLSARGTGDRVWGFTTASFEITKGAEGHLSETPAPSPDGAHMALVVREAGRRHLAVMNRDGQGSRTLAPSIDIQGSAEWSPYGYGTARPSSRLPSPWIAAGGLESGEQGLFRIPLDGGASRRLVSGPATDPAWSPNGDFIVYAGAFSGGSANPRDTAGSRLLAVRPDGRPYDFPLVAADDGTKEGLRVTPGGYRFVDQTHLVYRPIPESLDFWLFDLTTAERRRLTRLGNKGSLRGFDITPDGTHIVFDRVRQNSDIVLIERPKR